MHEELSRNLSGAKQMGALFLYAQGDSLSRMANDGGPSKRQRLYGGYSRSLQGLAPFCGSAGPLPSGLDDLPGGPFPDGLGEALRCGNVLSSPRGSAQIGDGPFGGLSGITNNLGGRGSNLGLINGTYTLQAALAQPELFQVIEEGRLGERVAI
jgi:hypothetical protein